MKELMKMKKLIKVLVFTVLLTVITVFSVSGLDAEFEKKIEAFPESYKVELRKLHEQYPLWEFEPFFTGLDWKTVIDKEHNDSALVYSSTAADIFKSLDSDDYNYDGGYFYEKDGGFIAASRLAVEYFMDPRNFLNKGGIFQFELLSFSDKFTVEMVEAVLEGSFMANKKMTYYDAAGKLYTDTMTYAEAMYKAGKTYNVNPCFLAAKIRNEVGSNGSDSVSGKNSSYPGIYNFYNIGASDGAGAIERGLLWASGSGTGKTSYSRPWNTPYKSIMGGAEFLAEDYISAGQFTGYLQRFNVNPNSDYKLYSHQYMTNLTGALSQGYSSYYSYYDMGMLNTALTFSIPIFKNMSDEEGTGSLVGAESALQYGKINVLYTRVRQGPSTDHPQMVDASGSTLYLDYGDEVRILEKVRTDAYYPSDILTYPYWYKVSFTSSGKTYTGYVCGEYVNVTTEVYVARGRTDISVLKSDSVKSGIFYSDPTMVKVIDSDTVEFLKDGSVSLYFYDSSGKIEEIRFKVGSYSSYYPKNLKAEYADNAISVSVDTHAKAQYYGFTVGNADGKIVKNGFITNNSTEITGLKSGNAYTVYTQYCFGKNAYSKTIGTTVTVKPQKTENLSFVKEDSGEVVLSWNAVENATGYQVLSYNESNKKYTPVLTVPFGQNSCRLTQLQASEENFVVRAYSILQGKTVYGDISNLVTTTDRPSMPDKVTVSSVTSSSYRISWQGVECDGYQVYYRAEGESNYTLYKETTDCFVTVEGLKSAEIRDYRVRAYKTVATVKLYSVATASISAMTSPSVPTGLTLNAGSNRIKASWKAVAGATQYTVYYKKSGGELKSETTEETSFMINGLEGYSTYYVAVSASVTKGTSSAESAKCTTANILTKPSAPKGLSVVSVGKNYVNIKWNADKSLDTYKIFLLDSNGKVVATKVQKGTEVKASPLTAGAAYSIIIKGYKLVDGKYISSENSQSLAIKAFDAKVSGITAETYSDKASFKWNKVSGAIYYQIYLYQNGSFKLVKTTYDTSCTVENLKDCTTNYIAVRAYFAGINGDYYGEQTTYKFYTRPLSVEKIVQSNRTDTSYTLTWEASSSAVNRYYVYRYNESTKKFDLLGSTAKTSCNIKGMTPGTLQSYAVVAAVIKDSKTLTSSKHTYSYTCGTYLSKTQNLRLKASTENAIQITWDAVPGATAYRVYCYDTAKKEFRLLGQTTSTVATMKNLKASTQYIYRVNAVKETEKVTFPGYYSSVLYASTK